MQSLTLTVAERRRLKKLARDAKRTPRAMLRFVLRDGFDYCSYVVKSVNEGIASPAGTDVFCFREGYGFRGRRSANIGSP